MVDLKFVPLDAFFLEEQQRLLRWKSPKVQKKEAELSFLHIIVSTVEKYKIPNSMILSLDQTSLKYAQWSLI